MKRGTVFAIYFIGISIGISIGITALDLCPTSYADRYYYRTYSRNYYDGYYYNSPVFGLRSPYVRERRPLNVPSSSYRSYPTYPPIFSMYPQPVPMLTPMPPGPWITPYSYSPYSYLYANYSPYRMIGSNPPTIIEREKIIIERQPASTESVISRESSPSTARSYIPSKPLGEEGSFVQLLDQAQRLFHDRNYQEAVEIYHQASGLSTGNALVKMGQALAWCAVGDYEGAASALRRALTLNPEWNEKPILVATFYGDTNDFNAHIARLEMFVKKSEKNLESRFLLAYLYSIADRGDEAAELLADLLDQNPNDLEATTLLGRLAEAKQKEQS